MNTFLIFLASIGTAYLASRIARRGPFTLPDLTIGLFSGFISLGLASLLSAEGAGGSMGLPLFLACSLTVGLQSLRRQPLVR
jgi:hypothetical protein